MSFPHLMKWRIDPGLIPGYTSLINGDIGKKRKMLAEVGLLQYSG
jgi:hypothetical protein